mgnify:CR=1 FL=1
MHTNNKSHTPPLASSRAGAFDVREEVTARIVEMLEKGAGEGFSFFAQSAAQGMPINAATGKRYSGVNILLLWVEAQERGFVSNLWMTYKQAQAMGAQVRKGAKAVRIVYADTISKEMENDKGEKELQTFGFLKSYCVFNVAEIDGLPAHLQPQPPKEVEPFELIERAESIFAATGAKLAESSDSVRCFYRISTDTIHMATQDKFTCPEAYHAVKLHELIHWTGPRLERELKNKFGSKDYAFEELVAELGSCFMAAEIGYVHKTLENHASYLESWLDVLKKDKQAIFKAAKLAGAACDYVLAFEEQAYRKAA